MKMILILKIKNISLCISVCGGDSSLESLKAKDKMTADSFEFATADGYEKLIMYLTYHG